MKLLQGDCLELLKEIPDNSIDTLISDPPYGLSKHSTEEVIACLSAWIKGEEYLPKVSGGFMGKSWDAWVPSPAVWKECFRVLKPGAMCLVFAGTRSMDLMAISLRLAGFELRDSIGYLNEDTGQAPLMAWVQGQGFPKSTDISKQLDKQAGVEREIIGVTSGMGRQNPEWNGTAAGRTENSFHPVYNLTAPATDAAKQWAGYGTALKPAFEPIILAMKPVEKTYAENALKYGVAGLSIEAGRVGTELIEKGNVGHGTGHNEGTFKLGFGVSKESQVSIGRFPANIITDGSEQVVSLFPETMSGAMKREVTAYEGDSNTTFLRGRSGPSNQHGDSGSAARFFYCAKASPAERNNGCESLPENERPVAGNNQGTRVCTTCGLTDNSINDHSSCNGELVYKQCKPLKNDHPTVKPVALLEYLCKITRTPTGGLVLDPFMGSGTTGVACKLTNRDFIGIELDPHYFEIAKQRIENYIPEKKKKISPPKKEESKTVNPSVGVKQPSLFEEEITTPEE